MTSEQMAATMMGTEKTLTPKQREGSPGSQPKLVIRDLTVQDDTGIEAVRGFNLTLNTHEIVGIAGVSGNGQKELVDVLAGQRQATQGDIQIGNQAYIPSRKEMTRHKLFCLPEEPLHNACVARMSVSENLAFRYFDQPPHAHQGLLNYKAIRRSAEVLIQRYRIKTPSPDTEIQSLSGGNIQRAVLARELEGDVQILIAANPCFGLDFAATAEIHNQIIQARNRGASVLLVSEDLDEVLELSDRLVVMFNGRLVYETLVSQADIATIGHYMAGQ